MTTGAPPPEREAARAMAKSLRAGDLDGAREAYTGMVRNRPEGATWQPGSPFAELGKAIVKGDLEGARTAFASMLKVRTEPVPVDIPTAGGPSPTGGDTGSSLHIVA
jgi:hypothetical protein